MLKKGFIRVYLHAVSLQAVAGYLQEYAWSVQPRVFHLLVHEFKNKKTKKEFPPLFETRYFAPRFGRIVDPFYSNEFMPKMNDCAKLFHRLMPC